MPTDPTTKSNARAGSASTTWLVVACAVGLGVLGCGGGGSSAMGGERQPCYPNGTCNTGLTCLSNVCVNSGGTGGKGGSGAAGSGGVAGTGDIGVGGSAAGRGGSAAGTGGSATGTGGTTSGTGGSGGTGGAVTLPPALGAQIDRMGRAQINTLVTGPFDADAASRASKQDMYSVATPGSASSFEAAFMFSLGIYDGIDAICGDQFLATSPATLTRYKRLADLLLDDQLYVDTSAGSCFSYMAVEISAATATPTSDCGGRTPAVDAIDVTYSLLIAGSTSAVTDGLAQDNKPQSFTTFPFLAAPN